MPEPAAETLTRRTAPAPPTLRERPSKGRGVDLADWVEHRIPFLKQRWHRELLAGYDPPPVGTNTLLEDFIDALLSFLPGLLGPHRDQVESVWIRCTELFGTVAAQRGLAAGEVIDEFQLLREAVIRVLYQDPPEGGRTRLSLRDVLRLNRAIDTGVTHASVGHTDALFFALFQGSGIPDAPPTSELMSEVRSQLDAMRNEVREILGRLPGEGDSAAAEEA